MSWFGTNPVGSALAATPAVNGAVALQPAGRRSGVQITGARRKQRGEGVSGTKLLGRVRGGRWGELPMTSSAGRQTAQAVRFATERAARESHRRSPSAPPDRPGVVIIASPSDLLAQLVAMTLLYARVPTCQLDPAELADVELKWRGRTVTVNGCPISGLLWRALIPGAAPAPMITASWLAVASFPSMRAVNAYDPDAWCRGAGWSVWGDRLADSGVPVHDSPEPGSAAARSLVVCGSVVAGPETEEVRAAADALDESGVHLASVTSLPNGHIADVDAQPDVSDSVKARRAATRIANYLAA